MATMISSSLEPWSRSQASNSASVEIGIDREVSSEAMLGISRGGGRRPYRGRFIQSTIDR